MIPVDMRIKHDPPNNMGDCFKCCVASILELPYEDVPHFVQLKDGGFNEKWFYSLSDWCKQFEIEPVLINALETNDTPPPSAYFGYGYCIATGQSKSYDKTLHSVVYLNTELVHDPSHTKKGIGDIVDFIVFVPLDPAEYIRNRKLRDKINSIADHNGEFIKPLLEKAIKNIQAAHDDL